MANLRGQQHGTSVIVTINTGVYSLPVGYLTLVDQIIVCRCLGCGAVNRDRPTGGERSEFPSRFTSRRCDHWYLVPRLFSLAAALIQLVTLQ